MNKSEIEKEMQELSDKAMERMDDCGDLTYLPNISSMDFLNEEERERMYELRKMLPSRGEEIQAARERIKQRIKNRNYENS